MPAWLRFRGRLRRRAFLLGALLLAGSFVALFELLAATAGRASTLVLYPPFYWLALALLVARLRDRGRSPAVLLLLLIPLLGPLWIAIEVVLRRGTRGDNRHGPDPRPVRLAHPIAA